MYSGAPHAFLGVLGIFMCEPTGRRLSALSFWG